MVPGLRNQQMYYWHDSGFHLTLYIYGEDGILHPVIHHLLTYLKWLISDLKTFHVMLISPILIET